MSNPYPMDSKGQTCINPNVETLQLEREKFERLALLSANMNAYRDGIGLFWENPAITSAWLSWLASKGLKE